MSSRDLDVCCSIVQAGVPVMQQMYADQNPGKELRSISTARSTAEQRALYAIGRTEPGEIKTNADGIRVLSNHQVQTEHNEFACHADDLGVFDSVTGEYLTDESLYVPFKTIADAAGLYSGWRFPEQNPKYKADPDHVECPKIAEA